ncbi:uncharacterized protein N7482_006078 [Penicillium canariense]|uniref:BZIP transcription factor n=1 Tax=Penicillium canariense TaxID=189055 RepID=A0A9W9I984_9EURO|nr:uncharacterized protein N7482_006078 [Penicillium canariense]KAJ5167297.1 hypothetical protein N7482_006078 [Penicillium canariense]
MSSNEGGPFRKRESRSGTRKVSSLSAEQLERKRANDREAQRSIRQRTKEHIEQLEKQVAMLQTQVKEMRPRSELDDVLRQNAVLQEEIRRLKHQLAGYTGQQGFTGSSEQTGPFRGGWDSGEGPSNAASATPTTNTMLASHFSASHPSASVPRAPSAVSASGRVSHPHDWQQSYSSTRSPSLGESSDPEFSARMEPYVMDARLQQSSRLVPPPLPIGASQISFGSSVSPNKSGSDPSFSQMYPVGPHPPPGQQVDGLAPIPQSLITQPTTDFLPNHREMSHSMSCASAPAHSTPAQPYQSSTSSYQNHPAQPPQRDPPYPYPWNPQS